MQWAGQPVTVDELAREAYTPGMKGTLQQDLIGASRRHGMMAVPIEGLDALLREIAAGHPVIVFENLAFSWYTQWHYALVFGYDLARREVLMHSGPEANKHWDMAKFERSWEYSDHWGLVVLPPGELASTANELAHLNAAAGLEQAGQSEAAEKSYLGIVKKWPQSLGALIGLGNVTYQRGDARAAVRYLRLATRYHPDSLAASHNLAVAEGALHSRK
jgi:tetratricopeptide (TPR) repeat protein